MISGLSSCFSAFGPWGKSGRGTWAANPGQTLVSVPADQHLRGRCGSDSVRARPRPSWNQI